MFSLSIRSALETIAEYDDEPWAKFSFYPCPVGASTPAGCLRDPCPPKEPGCVKAEFLECCVKDKFEDCLVHTLGCTDLSNDCDYDTRLKLSKFVGCFEGGHIEEDHCPQDPRNCTEAAGLSEYYDQIHSCFSNDTLVEAAGAQIDAACSAQNITFWPHVQVNGAQAGGPGCDEDHCVIPILPVLCKAYGGATKPKSCALLEQGLITVV